MTDVFVSYSRKDIAFARLLYQSLAQCDLDTWIDWERIPIGEQWWGEICLAIEKAHVFMFIISRNSISSNVCRDEINEALKHNKRIIPIVVDNLGPEVVGQFVPDLNKINWILFERDRIFQIIENPDETVQKPEDAQGALPKDPQYREALEILINTIHTDWEWVKYHTQLQVDALRWDTNQRNTSYMIRGSALAEAEQKLLHAGEKDPRPTMLQVEYITASRQEETHRQKEQLHLEQKARQRQRLALWTVVIGLVVTVVLGLFAWEQRNEAVSQSNTRATAQAEAVAESNHRATAEANAVNESNVRATAQAVAVEQRNVAVSKQIAIQANSLLDEKLDLALLLSLKATSISDDIEGEISLLKGIVHVPFLQKVLMTSEMYSSYGVAYSVDGSQIAAGNMFEIWIFDAQSGKLVQKYFDPASIQIMRLAYEPNGKHLAAGRSNGTIALWDLQKGFDQVPRVLDGDQEAITALAYSEDSRFLASGSKDGSVIIWDASSGKLLFSFHKGMTGYTAKINTVAFSPDGSMLAAGDWASYVYLLDTMSGEELAEPLNSKKFWREESMNVCVSGLAFHPDGKRLAVAAGLGVAVIDLDTRQALNHEPSYYRESCGVRGVAFTPDGKFMISGGCSELVVQEAETYEDFYTIDSPGVGIDSMAVSPDGKTFVTASTNSNVLLWAIDDEPWRIQNRVTPHLADDPQTFTVMDYARSADLFAANICPWSNCTDDDKNWHSIVIWERGNFDDQVLLENPGEIMYGMSFSPDGSRLAGVSDGKPEIFIWDIESHKIIYRLSIEGGFTPASIAFDLQGTLLYAAGCAHPETADCAEGAVQAWNLADGKPVGETILAHESIINQIAFRPDGEQFATVGKDDRLLIWDTSEMSIVGEIPIPNTFTIGIYTVVFSPDGQTIALATGVGQVHLVTLNPEPALSTTFTAPDGSSFYDLTFSPDGRYLVGATLGSGSLGGSIFLWDMKSLKQLGPVFLNNYMGFNYSTEYVSSVHFGETPSEIWVAGQRGLSVWNLDEKSLKSAACRLANRNFTAAEWEQYFPDDPYQLICPEQNNYIESMEGF